MKIIFVLYLLISLTACSSTENNIYNLEKGDIVNIKLLDKKAIVIDIACPNSIDRFFNLQTNCRLVLRYVEKPGILTTIRHIEGFEVEKINVTGEKQ